MPKDLVDGSAPPELPIELEGLSESAVLTRVRTVRGDRLEPESLGASCLRARASGAAPPQELVERVGTVGESVTFRLESGHGIAACDNSPGPRENDRTWCGGAEGRLDAGRLSDPRLDMLCSARDGQPLGFAWIQPSEVTRYMVVLEPSYAEVYEAAGNLPVRVATSSGVEVEGSRATFELSEHDAEGRLLRRYELEAAVAG